MEKLFIEWAVVDVRNEKIIRYCHNCGTKVPFSDSLKKRRNANGKDIYEYAIYKCPKGHTWNKIIKTYNSRLYSENPVLAEQSPGNEPYIQTVNIGQCLLMGVAEIEIHLKAVEGDWRLDKLLAEYLEDLSRSQIEKYIKCGKILINNQAVKTGSLVKTGQSVRIIL